MNSEKQIRHEKLIEFLNKFSQYQTQEGEPRLQKVKKARAVGDVKSISINDINLAVVAFTDVLNIMSGSAGGVDYYRLMQAYLTIPEYRDKINAVVEEAHSFSYVKSERQKAR